MAHGHAGIPYRPKVTFLASHACTIPPQKRPERQHLHRVDSVKADSIPRSVRVCSGAVAAVPRSPWSASSSSLSFTSRQPAAGRTAHGGGAGLVELVQRRLTAAGRVAQVDTALVAQEVWPVVSLCAFPLVVFRSLVQRKKISCSTRALHDTAVTHTRTRSSPR